MISFANLLRVLLRYLTVLQISFACSYEFNLVYEQREKSRNLLYCNSIVIKMERMKYKLHTLKNKKKRKSLRDIFAYNFLFYICLFVAANLS